MFSQISLRARVTPHPAMILVPILTLGLVTAAFAQPSWGPGRLEPAASSVGEPAGVSAASPPPAQAGPARRLSLDEAVAMALEQNLTLQVQRLNPRIQDLSIAQARSAWTPAVSSSFQSQNQDTPVNSFLLGGQDKVSDDLVSTSVGLEHLLSWGASYSVSWDSSRATTTNFFTNFDPIVRSNLNLSYLQPLGRNFKIDGARQQMLVSRKTREIADVELREAIVTTARSVKHAYWDLAFAISSLRVAQQSLDLARDALRNNQIRVEIGTMAPLDIVEAQAEVARNDETVIVAEAAIREAEDRLRALIMDPATPEFWSIRLEPTELPQLQRPQLDLEAAIRSALDKRTDVLAARKNLESADINIRYFRNQTLPDVNLRAAYSAAGVGGTVLEPFSGFPLPGQQRSVVGERGFGTVLGDIFKSSFPAWTVGVTIGYPLGSSSAEVELARAKLQHSQAALQIRSLELQIAVQVREVGRQAVTNLKRVEATRAARELAEKRLEAEQKKFSVGMSTNFLIFQAQRDLAQARNNELRATLDYSRSLVDFEAVQEIALGGTGIAGMSTVTTSAAVPVTGVTGTASTALAGTGASALARSAQEAGAAGQGRTR